MKTAVVIGMLALAVCLAVAEEPAETQDVTYRVGVDAETLDGLTGSIEDLAGMLEGYVDGPLAVYYEAAVKQNLAKAWSGIAASVLGIVLACWLIAHFRAKMRKVDTEYDATDEVECVFYFIAGVLLLVICGASLASFIPGVFAPEYYAIRDIVASLR